MNISRSQCLVRSICLALCLLFGLTPYGAAAAKAPGPPPALDTVIASGSGNVIRDVNINAQSGPMGENVKGTASFTVGGFLIHGSVTCLNVTGDTAVLNIQDPDDVFNVQAISVTDNGGNGRDTVALAPTARGGCSPPVAPDVDTLTNGRAIVFDAPPLPSAKQQCKHGGWAQFGFANQGQCLKFVNQS